MAKKTALVTTLSLVFLLGACSSSPTAGDAPEQSVETACALIETSMADLAVDLQQGGDGEEDVQEMVDTALRYLDRLSTEVTNPQVAEVLAPIAELQKQGLVAAAEGDEEAAVGAYLEMTDAYAAFWELCPSGAPE